MEISRKYIVNKLNRVQLDLWGEQNEKDYTGNDCYDDVADTIDWLNSEIKPICVKRDSSYGFGESTTVLNNTRQYHLYSTSIGYLHQRKIGMAYHELTDFISASRKDTISNGEIILLSLWLDSYNRIYNKN